MDFFCYSFWISCLVTSLAVLHFPPYALSTQDGSSSTCNTIEAAFTVRVELQKYFLSGDEYIEYSDHRGSEAKVGPITELGLGGRASHPDAAFTFRNNTLVLLKGCQYFKYRPNADSTFTLLEEGDNLGGLPCSPDAATESFGISVFKGCDVWTFSNTSQTFILNAVLSGSFPCDLDAALDGIIIRSTSYWTFDDLFFDDSITDILQGPYHTDDLNLCSWYLCGEADWMETWNYGRFPCNGDARLCHLRLDQVTLPGLHNAGSGFDGGFGFFDCWLKNHGRSILEQLELGIRYLDIDTSYYPCSVLGSHHNVFCGGSVCRMLKQTRTFLSRNPHEVIALTFNHEMQDMEMVMPALTRQLQTQLGPMLNNKFRLRGERRWPRLRHAVRTNQRVFVFYTPRVNDEPFFSQYYTPHKWIHTENWVGSTWREFSLNGENCSQIVSVTASRCRYHRYRELVEVSIVPTVGFGTCVDQLAAACSHFHDAALRACETYRFRHHRSPNVLLVDYPERETTWGTSVFQAVYHQNLRNIYTHRRPRCQVRVDAAAMVPFSQSHSWTSVFFVRSKVILYSHSHNRQKNILSLPSGITSVDSAYLSDEDFLVVTKDCQTTNLQIQDQNLVSTPSNWTSIPGCESALDAVDTWDGRHNVFHGCYVTALGQGPTSLEQLGLPCNIDAALTYGGESYVFKGNSYWVRREGQTTFSHGGSTLDWYLDAVVC
ncbi:Tat pathway signal sequence like protein [Elysia marginata]|uniref:Tat pathway signal sequence like protein n=1 Tax=Elysia marginata TaxID=1093978 RepID=A0AAV4FRK5_9GAST|nr:Tat pathway signal sequence like protein [Elysia marginata]